MEIDRLEHVELDGTTHWIRTSAADASKPVLLLMQLGPGLPIINEARRFERLFALREMFTVLYWDQRGTGLSLRDRANREGISVARMVADTVSMLESSATGSERSRWSPGSRSGRPSQRTPR
jgi:pimeloyl-ACP methyl ester carboxylesterase